MDFFSNILKNTVNKAETLGKAAQAAVNSFNQNNEERKNSNDQTVSDGNVNDNLSNDNNLVADDQAATANFQGRILQIVHFISSILLQVLRLAMIRLFRMKRVLLLILPKCPKRRWREQNILEVCF